MTAQSFTEVKKSWLAGCRLAKQDCNIQVSTVEKVLKQLDEIARRALAKP